MDAGDEPQGLVPQIRLTVPKEGDPVTPETYQWHLDWTRLREARAKDAGNYLLSTNLTDCVPKPLWKKYMIQEEIEYAFRELKNDIGLCPVYHRFDDRIEAHIFAAFMALCLLVSLRAIARACAPGLTPCPLIDKFKKCKMVDVVFPMTDGRTIPLPCHIEPRHGTALLLA